MPGRMMLIGALTGVLSIGCGVEDSSRGGVGFSDAVTDSYGEPAGHSADSVSEEHPDDSGPSGGDIDDATSPPGDSEDVSDRSDEPADVGSDDSPTEPGPGSEGGREVPLRGADNAFPLFGFEVSADAEDEELQIEMWELRSTKSGLQFPEVGACEGQGQLGNASHLGNPNYVGIILYQQQFSGGREDNCAATPEQAEYYRENHAVCGRFTFHNRTQTSYAAVYGVVNSVTPASAQAFAGARMSDPPRTVELEDGEVVILDPWSDLGTYYHGPMGAMNAPEGNEADADWIFLMRNRSNISAQGVIWFVVEEVCGTGTDDNCDGLADSGCGLFGEGDDCLRDSDCAEGLRCDGVTLEDFGECVED